jgi:hypothetical protein
MVDPGTMDLVRKVIYPRTIVYDRVFAMSDLNVRDDGILIQLFELYLHYWPVHIHSYITLGSLSTFTWT